MLLEDVARLVSWICGSGRLRGRLLWRSVGCMNGIETDRLRLRCFTEADAEFVLKLVNDEGWLRYIGDRGIGNVEQARAYIGKMVSQWKEHGYGAYLVALKETGALLGLAGLFQREGLDHPDIGFALLAEYRGYGYAWESSEALLRKGWDRGGFTRITAITVKENRASIRLLEKLGLKFEQTMRLPGGEQDLERYAMARPA